MQQCTDSALAAERSPPLTPTYAHTGLALCPCQVVPVPYFAQRINSAGVAAWSKQRAAVAAYAGRV